MSVLVSEIKVILKDVHDDGIMGLSTEFRRASNLLKNAEGNMEKLKMESRKMSSNLAKVQAELGKSALELKQCQMQLGDLKNDLSKARNELSEANKKLSGIFLLMIAYRIESADVWNACQMRMNAGYDRIWRD